MYGKMILWLQMWVELVILERYTSLVEETVNRIECNVRENDELSKIRDFLLPLLMNGQVGFRED